MKETILTQGPKQIKSGKCEVAKLGHNTDGRLIELIYQEQLSCYFCFFYNFYKYIKKFNPVPF